MKVNHIPLLETGYFSGLTKAYLSNEHSLKPFYNHYFNLSDFELTIQERRQFEVNRNDLFEVLKQQHAPFYQQFSYLESTVESIKENQTFTITTGHQICLATGPLYFIYKIASAIKLSCNLKALYPQYNFVPLYWMATEDHDFEEIKSIHLFNKKISWDVENNGATGRIKTEGIQSFINQIKEILGDKINVSSFSEVIFNAYENNTSLAEATREMVLNLFSNEGLLVLDADNALLKNSFKEIIKQDIVGQVSYKAVTKSIEELVSSHLIKEEKIQVKPRAINFFYLKDNFRKRITFENNLYYVLDTDILFTEAQLMAEIEQFPDRFSPNVIMRPLYQEHILPNLAYIGGAGELSYWFELKKAFEAHHTFFPSLVLRNSFLWLDKKQAEKLHQFGFTEQNVFEPTEMLIEKVLTRTGMEEIQFQQEKIMAEKLFDQLKTSLKSVDTTLGASADGEKHKLLKSIELLEQKANKAQKMKHETLINQVKKIKENLFPNNGLQERHENVLWLNAKIGAELIKKIITLTNLERIDFIIVTEE